MCVCGTYGSSRLTHFSASGNKTQFNWTLLVLKVHFICCLTIQMKPKCCRFFLEQIHGYWLFSSLKFYHKASHQLNRCWERLITENWKRMCCVRFNADLVQSPFPRTRSPISFRMVRASISLNQRTNSCCWLLSLYNQNETNLIHISNQ